MSSHLFRRWALPSLLLLLIAFVIAACAPTTPPPHDSGRNGEDRYGGTIRIAATAYPANLDPYTWGGMQMNSSLVEQLVTYDEEWAIIPQLAEDYYHNEDYTRWTFTLRQSVMFHNGEEMTAEDVKASIRRFKTASPRAVDLDAVESVEIVSSYEIVLHLSEPLPILPIHLAYPLATVVIMPASVLADADPYHLDPQDIVGTGPYYMVEAIPDRYVRLARFENYTADERYEGPTGYGGRFTAYANELLFIPVPEASSRTAGILAGDYDFAEDLPKSDYDTLVAKPGVSPIISPSQWQPVIYFNTQEGALFRDLNLRRAVQVALDMEELMIAAAERPEFFRLDSSFFFAETVWHNEIGAELGLYNANDKDWARELVEQSDYDGRTIVILSSSDYHYMYSSAIVLQDQLKKVGFNVQLRIHDWPTVVSVRSGLTGWDLFVSSDGVAHDGSYMNYFHTAQDWLGHSNPRLDKLLEEGMRHADFASRNEIYAEVSRLFYEDVTWIKFGDMHEVHGARDQLQGYIPFRHLRFWNVWLDG